MWADCWIKLLALLLCWRFEAARHTEQHFGCWLLAQICEDKDELQCSSRWNLQGIVEERCVESRKCYPLRLNKHGPRPTRLPKYHPAPELFIRADATAGEAGSGGCHQPRTEP